VPESPDDFRFLGYSGFVVLTANLSESDPIWTSTNLIRSPVSSIIEGGNSGPSALVVACLFGPYIRTRPLLARS